MNALWTARAALAIGLLSAVATVAAEPPEFRRQMRAGDEASRGHDWAKAVEAFRKAAEAAGRDAPGLRAQADLRRALAIRAWVADGAPEPKAREAEQIECYKDVIARGAPADREVAANNLGVL